jgi:hypothetical protein
LRRHSGLPGPGDRLWTPFPTSLGYPTLSDGLQSFSSSPEEASTGDPTVCWMYPSSPAPFSGALKLCRSPTSLAALLSLTVVPVEASSGEEEKVGSQSLMDDARRDHTASLWDILSCSRHVGHGIVVVRIADGGSGTHHFPSATQPSQISSPASYSEFPGCTLGGGEGHSLRRSPLSRRVPVQFHRAPRSSFLATAVAQNVSDWEEWGRWNASAVLLTKQADRQRKNADYRERIANFLAVPLAVEKVTLFGALLCIGDSPFSVRNPAIPNLFPRIVSQNIP